MIAVDMKTPKTCYRCPFVNTVRYGPYAGRDMCNVRASRGEPVIVCLVELDSKPDWCPLMDIPDEKRAKVFKRD